MKAKKNTANEDQAKPFHPRIYFKYRGDTRTYLAIEQQKYFIMLGNAHRFIHCINEYYKYIGQDEQYNLDHFKKKIKEEYEARRLACAGATYIEE